MPLYVGPETRRLWSWQPKNKSITFIALQPSNCGNGGSEKTVDELYDQWRFENLGPDEVVENVAAIQASIDDMNRGETGRDAADVIRELRDELDLPPAE